jgi:hypothetical protein
MSTILNIHKLNLSETDIANLDRSAGMYAANSRISFKVLRIDEDELIIEVRQDKNIKESYLSKKELIDRAKNLFTHFFPNHKIHVRPQPYEHPEVDIVDTEWILDRMNKTNTSIKDIVSKTGIDKGNVSNYVNGNKPLSQISKAMFYYMLR